MQVGRRGEGYARRKNKEKFKKKKSENAAVSPTQAFGTPPLRGCRNPERALLNKWDIFLIIKKGGKVHEMNLSLSCLVTSYKTDLGFMYVYQIIKKRAMRKR